MYFFPDGQLRGIAPILLGLTVGDYSTPGIGGRPLSNIRIDERTTPAGRFVSVLDYNIKNEEILWVDYDLAFSIHPVVKGKAKDRRLERLFSPQSSDNRISFGCINIPVNFFEEVVKQEFAGTDGIVYVLPETKTLKEVFHSYVDVSENY